MKRLAAILLVAAILVCAVAAPKPAHGKVAVGVKEGDWIEYSLSMRGPPLDVERNLTWYRMEILSVEGAVLEVNKTALSVNGTFSSSVWSFNLAEGLTFGWVIIPAGLGMGDVFFDASKSANVTVEGETQRTLLGVSRTVTYASDPGRLYREWDKATGVYVYSLENTTSYTVQANLVATNLWSLPSQEQTQTQVWLIAAVAGVVTAAAMALAVILARKKEKANPSAASVHRKT
ncbi:MAG: hypothetical protein NWE93_14680 [Candidatus Bathyarchaeota archaeon]|nr:hypothetical protein [Candidatus Bathyarchaeota archaeon]